jgi:DNA-binding transcriptional regulator YdaS (Cro superfamily)
MNIRDYLHERYMTATAFASMLDISPKHLTAVKNGRLPASKKLAKKIEQISGGKVLAEEVLKPIAEKKSA